MGKDETREWRERGSAARCEAAARARSRARGSTTSDPPRSFPRSHQRVSLGRLERRRHFKTGQSVIKDVMNRASADSRAWPAPERATGAVRTGSESATLAPIPQLLAVALRDGACFGTLLVGEDLFCF